MKGSKVYVAGHRGLVGSALVRELERRSYASLITRTRSQLDLRDQTAVAEFFRAERPEIIFLAAAKVGGIHANNTERWEFLFENLQIQNNILGGAMEHDVKKVVFFGSSCIYPKLADQPLREDYLLTGPLEPTNEPYAIAKIAGLKLVEAANQEYGYRWLSLMPTNLYGPGDNFDLESSHVLPAMIRKFHEAKERLSRGLGEPVKLWGTGSALREFLHVDDLARASMDLMEQGASGLYNVGSGEEVSIKQLAEAVAGAVGYDGPVEWDRSKPDGTPRKLLDSSKVRALGWTPKIKLAEGLKRTYEWFVANRAAVAA
ncbi:MAG: GDP-L-fucose synthase family protein [Gemmatimonadaceae bacterium]